MDTQQYTGQEAVENYLTKSIAAQYLDQVDEWALGVSRYIMQVTGRQFVADAAASARLFDGDGTEELIVDDFVDSAHLTVEAGTDDAGTSFSTIPAGGATGYILLPNNAAARGVPFRKIVLRSDVFVEGMQNHRITARWGYAAEVPEDIKFAATVLVAGILTAMQEGSGTVQSERIGNYSVQYADRQGLADFERAKAILDFYKKHEL